MPTTFYDDNLLTANVLYQNSGIEDATFTFWRNQQQTIANQQSTIVTVGYVTGPAPTITIADSSDWPAWVTQTQAITQTLTWGVWNGGTTAGTNIYMPPTQPVTYQGIPLQYDPPPFPRPEDVALRDAARREHQQAIDRAEALLWSFMNPAQRESLYKKSYFDIVGSSGKRYRIRKGSHGNVIQLDDRGREAARYCGQPNGVPVGDMMLAQKLQIETDEAEFLRLANCLEGQRAA